MKKTGAFEDYAENAQNWCPDSDKQKIELKPYTSKQDLMGQIRKMNGQVDMIVIIDHGGVVDGRSYQYAGRLEKNNKLLTLIPDEEMMEILKRAKHKAILTGCRCAETEDTKGFLDNAAKQLNIKILANEKLTGYMWKKENGNTEYFIDTSQFITFPRENLNNPVPQPNNPVPQPNNPVPQPNNPIPQPNNPVLQPNKLGR